MTDLATRLAAGDLIAWEQWYDAMSDSIFHYLSVTTSDDHAAHDVLQVTFLRLYRTRIKLPEIDDLKAYTFVIARNEAFRWLDRNKAQRQTVPIDQLFLPASKSNHGEDHELVLFALKKLNPSEQEIVQLKVYSNLTFAQVAEIVGLAMGTCATRYRRSLAKMKSTIQEQLR